MNYRASAVQDIWRDNNGLIVDRLCIDTGV